MYINVIYFFRRIYVCTYLYQNYYETGTLSVNKKAYKINVKEK